LVNRSARLKRFGLLGEEAQRQQIRSSKSTALQAREPYHIYSDMPAMAEALASSPAQHIPGIFVLAQRARIAFASVFSAFAECSLRIFFYRPN